MSVITIMGAGVMGSAMCLPACDRGHAVRLVGTHLDRDIIDSVKASGLHPKLNVELPKNVSAYHHEHFSEALGKDTDLIILGVSSAGVGWAIDRLSETLKTPVEVVMLTKGMQPEGDTLKALPGHIAGEVNLRTGLALNIAAIGGPCIAGELAVRRHTGTVITSHDLAFAQRLAGVFQTGYYHPRASSDVIGVETCAAFKNFFAIAVGWAAGKLETMAAASNRAFNHNAAAIIFDQAVRELMVLTLALGGTAESVWGMPGAGDLYVTCQAGRNSRLGQNLGRGLTYQETRDGPMRGDTIEGAELGIAAAPALRALIKQRNLDMPLALALLDALTQDLPLDIPWTEFHGRA